MVRALLTTYHYKFIIYIFLINVVPFIGYQFIKFLIYIAFIVIFLQITECLYCLQLIILSINGSFSLSSKYRQ